MKLNKAIGIGLLLLSTSVFAGGGNTITVYTQPGCEACVDLEGKLHSASVQAVIHKLGYSLHEVDVTTHSAPKGVWGTPTTFINHNGKHTTIVGSVSTQTLIKDLER